MILVTTVVFCLHAFDDVDKVALGLRRLARILATTVVFGVHSM